jgi:hypothetical protein
VLSWFKLNAGDELLSRCFKGASILAEERPLLSNALWAALRETLGGVGELETASVWSF